MTELKISLASQHDWQKSEFILSHDYYMLSLLYECSRSYFPDTRVGGQLYLPPPSQNPVFLNSHKNSIFLHSRKRPAPVTDTFFATWGCPLRLSLYPNFESLMNNL